MQSPRDLGPGIHRVDGPDAAAREAELSAVPGAIRCETDAAVDHILRAGAGGGGSVAVEELRTLAARAVRAKDIAERTRRRAVTEAGGRLAGGTAVAVHPDAVRARAAAVLDAREALVRAERAIADHEATAPPAAPADVADAAVPAVAEGPGWLRARRNQAIGAVVAAFGLALVLLAVGVLPLWAVLLVPLVASIVALRILGGGSPQPPAARPDSLLADMDSFTGAAEASRASAEVHEATRARLEVERTLAEEDLRVAERSWHDLAGPDQSVEDLEEVVRRFDPHHDAAEAVAAESLSVRAMAGAAVRLEEEWGERWAALGRSAPALDDGPSVEEALRALASDPGQVVVLLTEAVAGRADEVARTLPEATVVVVSEAAGAS